ncbi:MAG: hypothetical protein EBX37_07155 [Alphaproteobacteria bacterium]|nr:hypothetical protein [Alphaproteobacteria bacterium]
MRGFITTLALLLPLMGCGPLSPSASLPYDAALGAADPTRAAIFSTAYAFNNPGGLATPAIAARAAANVEFLAVSLPHDVRYGSSPTVNQQMAAARREMHAALGIVEAANPQLVVNGLYAASRALAAGDNAAAESALAPAVFSNGEETLRRLAAMGPWPRTAEATAMAEREHLRIEQERINSQPGGDSSGRN